MMGVRELLASTLAITLPTLTRRMARKGKPGLKECSVSSASAPVFTHEHPLRVHVLRCLSSENLLAFRSRLSSNVVVTCLTQEEHDRAVKGEVEDATELLPSTREEVHIIVEGFLPLEIVEAILECAKPHCFLIPYAGVSERLRPVLEKAGVSVFNSHHNAPMTAELCISLILAASKQTVTADAQLRANSWRGRGVPLAGSPVPTPVLPTLTLQGKTCCVLGIRGKIGRRVARAMAAMEMDVVGTSGSVRLTTGASFATLDLGGGETARVYPATQTIDALRGADVVVVAVPDTPETRGIIGEEEIQAMHGGSETKQCVLVNVGRGVCCDGDAVHRALENGELFAFASDVWYTYPKTWDEAADCPPVTPSGLSFATGIAGSKSTLSSHRGGSPGQAETEMRRIGAMAAAFNYAASAGDAAALASGPDSLIGRVSLAKGF